MIVYNTKQQEQVVIRRSDNEVKRSIYKKTVNKVKLTLKNKRFLESLGLIIRNNGKHNKYFK